MGRRCGSDPTTGAKRIGARIRELRTKMGYTIASLSKKAGISGAQVSRLENGLQGFRSRTLSKIAEALDVPVIYFHVDDKRAFTLELEREIDRNGPGLAVPLRSALANPAFLRYIERCAGLFLRKGKKLQAMEKAVKRVTI